MEVNARELEALNCLFLRVLAKIFIGPYHSPEADEMTVAQKRLLYILDLNGPQRMSEIARLSGVTLPAATAVVDRLVEAGLVERHSEPNDRRVVRIALTEKGRKMIASMNSVHERRLRDVLEKLTPEERTALVEHFRSIYDLLTLIETR
ncbi:MAG: MarR family transcriptional regulator [Candidatus Hydrogenedentota bacterium]|uniref:Transcriptional regulator, MarR family n=1 Tax=Sumerlaea chitinivorans TaxID=2250252 RepID=A0A2Z4Y627_SUMC1|nr:Transcriptional regulator, MarR family [Candidatus Sumerlaea chitinivorans]MCX7963730.1 MarR family transcriptional regulator [Candidatus Sumerlaea chitinivorans]RMH25106.1 MAG: MarR family transcriptional regulator [Candidatus Hydrogenedentota bacterium]